MQRGERDAVRLRDRRCAFLPEGTGHQEIGPLGELVDDPVRLLDALAAHLPQGAHARHRIAGAQTGGDEWAREQVGGVTAELRCGHPGAADRVGQVGGHRQRDVVTTGGQGRGHRDTGLDIAAAATEREPDSHAPQVFPRSPQRRNSSMASAARAASSATRV